MEFLDVFNTLNKDGRKKVVEYTKDIASIDLYRREKYKKEEP